jgi:uncharacterized RDD family membrane protein YckC
MMNYFKRLEYHPNNELILAPLKKRFAAFLVDWLILVAVYICMIKILNLFGINLSKVNVVSIFDVEIETENLGPSFLLILKILFGFLPIVYFTLLSFYWKGQTIGKLLFKIRIVSLYHQHLGFWHCTERSLGYFASALEFGFGFIQAYWNPNRMALHDKIGETIVISLPAKKRV